MALSREFYMRRERRENIQNNTFPYKNRIYPRLSRINTEKMGEGNKTSPQHDVGWRVAVLLCLLRAQIIES